MNKMYCVTLGCKERKEMSLYQGLGTTLEEAQEDLLKGYNEGRNPNNEDDGFYTSWDMMVLDLDPCTLKDIRFEGWFLVVIEKEVL